MVACWLFILISVYSWNSYVVNCPITKLIIIIIILKDCLHFDFCFLLLFMSRLANCCCLFFSPPYKYMFLSGLIYNLYFFTGVQVSCLCGSSSCKWRHWCRQCMPNKGVLSESTRSLQSFTSLSENDKPCWCMDSNNNNNEFSVFGPRSYDCFLSSNKRKTLKIQAFFSLLLKKRSWL